MWDVGDVEYCGCEMLGMWDVGDMGFGTYKMPVR